MVFVIIGTQKQPFDRLIKMLDESEELLNEEIIIQKGYTNIENKRYITYDFLDEVKFEEYIKKADLIITHSGVGSIINSLKYDKKIIAIPRLSKYKEHMDDHQIEIANKFENLGYIATLKENESLDDCIKNIKNKEFEKYKEDTSYIDKLINVIDNI